MTTPEVAVVVVADAEQLATAYRIRVEVFVDEQHVPMDLELDERDADAEHFLVVADDEPVGTARIVVEPPGFEGSDPALGEVAHLGRIAVLLPHRGRGHGAALVRALEARAAERGLRAAYLSAQVVALPFYEKLGYAAHGGIFDDAGIDHRHMTKPL